jgi:hypothetical protein
MRMRALPARLSETGLYADGALRDVRREARSFEPAFALWSDAAQKHRWIALPAGAQIDTSDMDDWQFPAGTKLWKEFSLEGRRLETRMLTKVGPGPEDWAGAAYVWLPDQSDAVVTPQGADDVAGTDHDVPSAAECVGCHRGRRSFVLGFSAIQLGSAGPGAPLPLEALMREGVLTNAPSLPLSVPGNETERAALGYLHANCGNCHNSRRPVSQGPRCYDPRRNIDFWLSASGPRPSASQTPAYRTAVPEYIHPADPDGSALIALTSRRGGFLPHMPPLASEQVDREGVSLLRRWIGQMPAPEGHR